jgi:hypothetical protein
MSPHGDPGDPFSLEPIHLSRLPIDSCELLRDPPEHRLPAIKDVAFCERSPRRIDGGKLNDLAALAAGDAAQG